MPISPIDVTLLYPNGGKAQVELRKRSLNRGADGIIHEAPGGKLALKIYHDPEKDPDRAEKIWQMVLSPPDDRNLEHFAWPVAQAVNRTGRFIGYAMPLLPLQEYTSLELLVTRKGRRLAQLPEFRAFRVQAAQSLALRVSQLHARGHRIIDMKPANLLVNRKTADIVVVDCDGFAIQADDHLIPGHQYTTGYIAPEAWRRWAKPEDLGESQDLFALAVIVFQLLNEGLHPYEGLPEDDQSLSGDTQSRIGEDLYAYGQSGNPRIKPSPFSVHQDFPDRLCRALDRAFVPGGERPSAQAWVALLGTLSAELNSCGNDASHTFWGDACPLCDLDSLKLDLTPGTSSPSLAFHHTAYTFGAQPPMRQAGSIPLFRTIGFGTAMVVSVLLGFLLMAEAITWVAQ